VFSNTCPSAPSFYKLAEKGFSTKEGMRGVGLYVMSEILQNNNKLTLATKWEDGYFIQELRIATAQEGDYA